MSRLSKSVKVRFTNRPRGFVGAMAKALQFEIDKRAPLDTGRLESTTRVTSQGDGVFKATNSRNYASYVDRSGPRADGSKLTATKKFFTGVMNARRVNEIARKVRKRLGGK